MTRAARTEPHSVWAQTLDREVTTPSLRSDPARSREADVVIIGAGYTGLWTAWHLITRRPELDIVVLEAHQVGHGASGRNGGWCSGASPVGLDTLAARIGVEGTHRFQRSLIDTVTAIGDWCRHEGVDAGYAPGGWIQLARNRAQQMRVEQEVATYRRFGFDDTVIRLEDADETALRVRARGVRASSFATHTAAIHPLALVTGLAHAVARRGVTIVEKTSVRQITSTGCETSTGSWRAPWVVRATEGYSASLRGARRDLAPVHSLMIATEPLEDSLWDEIGLQHREVVNDARRLVIYAQRTADGRLAFGGRGAPYHFGSRTGRRFDTHSRIRDHLLTAVRDLWPVLSRVEFPYHWGGPLGVSRDLRPHLVVDRTARRAWAGGYLGDGVAASALTGRALADHVLDRPAPLDASLPGSVRRWEPEPFRFVGVNLMLRLAGAADRFEDRFDRPAPVVDRLLGHPTSPSSPEV